MIPIYPIDFETLNQNVSFDIIFQAEDGTQYKRSGYCSRCGDCCEDIDNIFKDEDGDGNTPGLDQVVAGKCAYFRWGDDGLAMCTGRNTKYYKNGCIISPTVQGHIENYSNCTYSFEKVK